MQDEIIKQIKRKKNLFQFADAIVNWEVSIIKDVRHAIAEYLAEEMMREYFTKSPLITNAEFTIRRV